MNEHHGITGSRNLTQAEIDLINEIKAEGERLQALILGVRIHIRDNVTPDTPESDNPYRWTSIAQTDFQTGLMALARAVARPTSF